MRRGAFLIFALLARSASAQSLGNAHLRVEFGPHGLRSISDGNSGRAHRLADEGFTIVLDNDTIVSTALPRPAVTSSPNEVRFRYSTPAYALVVRYELRPSSRFVSRRIEVSAGSHDFRVRDVAFRHTLTDAPTSVYQPRSTRPNLETGVYGAAARFPAGRGLLFVVQNPFLRVEQSTGGATPSRLDLRYSPEMDWKASYGPFTTDRELIAPVQLSGRVLPAAMTPEWHASRSDTTRGMDEVEVATFTDMVRAFLLDRKRAPINVFVGWCANDYQIDAGTPEGRAEYKRVLDQAAALGAKYVLYAPSNSALSRREESVDDWSWEHVLWLGLGQKIRRNEWDARTSPVPPSVREMIDYARGKGLGLLAYVYPVLPFAQNPEWLVPGRNPQRQNASLGNRALQDWLIEELVAFHHRTGIAGYAFDHTFLTYTGTSRYAQWWGWRRVMEELRRRVPDIVVDGRQAYHLYGPWSWLAGSYPHPTFNDEQPESFVPYPDLHFDRVSADRERWTAYRYRNYEFAPSEIVPGFITHQTSRSDDTGDMPSIKTSDRGVVLTSFRARDWDYLGWRYSVLSSIAVGGWNNVLNMIPARDTAEFRSFSMADREWMRRWLAWTVEHKEYLRNTRTILGQPGLGKIDGTSALLGGRGFLFLFNPDARRLTANVRLDRSIGLAPGRFVLRELYPMEGRLIGKPSAGTWSSGDDVTVGIDGGSATVLEVSPAPTVGREPVVYGAPGRGTLRADTLELSDVRGETGTVVRLTVALPASTRVRRVRLNGVPSAFDRQSNGLIELDAPFEGAEFHRLQPAYVSDSLFAAARLGGTFTIPQRVFDQLAARRTAWPIPWTPADSSTTWLVPERLLLYAQFADPDARWEARLTIDGRPVELRKAYTAVRAEASTFVGFYADVSALQPDRAHRFELELPAGLKPGQFRGLFFENVEPEYTNKIVGARR